jgi:hypothetical protein
MFYKSTGAALPYTLLRYTVYLSWASGEVVLWHPALRIRIRRIHIFWASRIRIHESEVWFRESGSAPKFHG